MKTYLPLPETFPSELSVKHFNQQSFHLGFVYTLWESSCGAVNEYHSCLLADLAHEFLLEFRPLPKNWPRVDESFWINPVYKGHAVPEGASDDSRVVEVPKPSAYSPKHCAYCG